MENKPQEKECREVYRKCENDSSWWTTTRSCQAVYRDCSFEQVQAILAREGIHIEIQNKEAQ
jgi:hypothetical protein